MRLTLYNLAFVYNPYNKTLTVFHREDWNAYWNGTKSTYKMKRFKNVETVSIDKILNSVQKYGLRKNPSFSAGVFVKKR